MKSWLSVLPFGGLALVAAFFGASPAEAPAPPVNWKVIAFPTHGVHAIDPDYGVFALKPLGNSFAAQVLTPSGTLAGAGSGVSVTYEAVADATGSSNRSSIGKTNFWTHAAALFGTAPPLDVGLSGAAMPGLANTPQPMNFDVGARRFRAHGVPLTPYDDAFRDRPYPMMRLVARSSSGTPLAETTVVTAVSDEFSCSTCHGSGYGIAAPFSGAVFDANADRDWRRNILKIHDDLNLGTPLYAAALLGAGYDGKGLLATSDGGTPVACVRCHASNDGAWPGQPGVEPLTGAMHGMHAFVPDPEYGISPEFNLGSGGCYRCHPGRDAATYRGPMSRATKSDGTRSIHCRDCHGTMTSLAAPGRAGWLDEPQCQSCHTGTALANNGQLRYSSVFDPGGQVRVAVDATFATTPDVPSQGFSLFKDSVGHGGLACSACHGAAHAEGRSSQPNDNVQNQTLQGHASVLVECTACHATMPNTVFGGPHGIHPVGDDWVDEHEDVPSSQIGGCRACHGLDYRGTVLSETHADRSFTTEFGTVTFARGARVSCFACHDGPGDDDPTSNHRPVAQHAIAATSGDPVAVTLVATDQDADALEFRILEGPQHGSAGVAGSVLNYIPDAGFAGTETIRFTAWDGKIDSVPRTVTITRGAEWASYGTGVAGSTFTAPLLVPDAAPRLGTSITIHLENVAGHPSPAILVIGSEPATIPLGFNGLLLVRPETVFGFTLPAEGLDLPWAVPVLPSLTGLSLYGQLAHVDPQAPFLLAVSRGLRLTLGP